MRGIFLGIFFGFSVFLSSYAEEVKEEVKPYVPHISGHIEATGNFNLAGREKNDLRSFDYKSNTFLLNSAMLLLQGDGERFSYTIKTAFGSDPAVFGNLNSFFATPSTPYVSIGVDVYEAYIKYRIMKNLSIIAGRFVTFEGIEVIEGIADPTISRGYLFGLAEPFTHTGAYSLIEFEPIFFKVGAINGWDVLFDNNKGKTGIAEIGFTSEKISFDIAYYIGPEQPEQDKNLRHSVDLTGILKIPKVDLWFQGNFGTEKIETGDDIWYGAGIQPIISLFEFSSKSILVGGRYEFFYNKLGSRGLADGATAHNITLTPTLKDGDFMFRIEYRVDFANKEIFDGKKDNHTISVGVSFSF